MRMRAPPARALPSFPKEPAHFHNWLMMPHVASDAQPGFTDCLRVITQEPPKRSPRQGLAMVWGRFLARSGIGFSPFTGFAQGAFHLGIGSR